MSHDQDLVSRLVDYHDHIAVVPVPVGDDVRRGRRRVRRNRGLLAGGTALGVAALMVGAALLLDGGPGERPEPVGPSRDGEGMPAALVAPESVAEVRELGFHVEPLPGFDPSVLGGGWTLDEDGQTILLRWDEVGDEISVTLGYEGGEARLTLGEEDVTIHGVRGRYYEGAHISDVGFIASLEWEYAPGAWAVVEAGSDRGGPGT